MEKDSRYSQADDRELVAAANRGDRDAMTAFYTRYRDWVYAFALRLCGNESDAADALQEVFLYLFRKFPGFELRGQMKTLLYPVVRNAAVSQMRSRRRLAPLEGEQAESLADEREPAASAALQFAEIVAGLPEDEREVVILRFSESMSLQEISEKTGVPLGTVKSRLHRALGRLKQQPRGP